MPTRPMCGAISLANRYLFWQTSLSYLSHSLVLGYGGWLVFERHQLTPGDIVMFVAYLDRLYCRSNR